MDPVTIIVGGGLAALAISSATDSSADKQTKGIQPAPAKKVTVASIQATRGRVKTAAIGVGGLPQTTTISPPGTRNNSVTLTELERKLEEKIKKEYEALDATARKEGAKIINRELGTNLTGNEDWEKLSGVVGAAAGAYGGGAVGAAIAGPVGAVVGKYLGAIAGAYIGAKAYELLDDAWSEVEDFAADLWEWGTGLF